jgi:chromate reductase
MLKVAVFVGSPRPVSTNLKLAKALEKLAKDRLSFDYVDIASLPFYDDSLWNEPPAAVLRLKRHIEQADAVLFVTPEYNRSIPGILKNAIDWPSRPYGDSVWYGKPAAIVGASPGATGTAAAQAHLRSILPMIGTVLMGTPEVYLSAKPGLFDEDDNVTDDRTRTQLANWTVRFSEWIARFAQPRAAQADGSTAAVA